MNIVQKPETNFDKKYYAGMERFEIVKINPTRKELNELYDKEPSENEEEIDYISNKEGKDIIRVAVYMKGIDTDRIVSESFFIKEDYRISDKDPDNVKHQYINTLCETSWADTEENLPLWFTKFLDKDRTTVLGDKVYRKATEGEGDFYEFVRNVMTKVNFYNKDTSVMFDRKKMLRGDFSQLNSFLANKDYCPQFVSLNYVKNTTTEDGSIKTYNQVYLKSVINPTLYSKYIAACDSFFKEKVADNDLMEELGLTVGTYEDVYGYVEKPRFILKNQYDQKAVDRFMKQAEGEYGCKGFYKFTPVFEYNEKMDVTATNTVISEAGSDY